MLVVWLLCSSSRHVWRLLSHHSCITHLPPSWIVRKNHPSFQNMFPKVQLILGLADFGSCLVAWRSSLSSKNARHCNLNNAIIKAMPPSKSEPYKSAEVLTRDGSSGKKCWSETDRLVKALWSQMQSKWLVRTELFHYCLSAGPFSPIPGRSLTKSTGLMWENAPLPLVVSTVRSCG